jgi:hypothetical protein
MGKKCIICHEEAKFKIKDTSDYYCQECAEENFSDLDLLITMEEEAKRLKEYLKEKMADLVLSEKELEEKLSSQQEEDVQNDKTGQD